MKETEKIALSNGYIDLHHCVKKLTEKISLSELPILHDEEKRSHVKSEVIFDAIREDLPNNLEAAAKVNAIVLYTITKDSKPIANFSICYYY